MDNDTEDTSSAEDETSQQGDVNGPGPGLSRTPELVPDWRKELADWVRLCPSSCWPDLLGMEVLSLVRGEIRRRLT